MILEGLVTTLRPDGSVNLAPMGAIVDRDLRHFTLRPFLTATTFDGLSRTHVAVFHVVDDVLLLAQAALEAQPTVPPTELAQSIDGRVLLDCCRWYELRVATADATPPRSTFELTIAHAGWRRDVWGFNRAQHAVLEATILATRVHLLPREEIAAALALWEPLVAKTGGDREVTAWDYVVRFIAERTPTANLPSK